MTNIFGGHLGSFPPRVANLPHLSPLSLASFFLLVIRSQAQVQAGGLFGRSLTDLYGRFVVREKCYILICTTDLCEKNTA
jgi:hypothetical protein